MKATKSKWNWACLECGHKFRSVKAAERACFGSGCPKCGGADIDLVKEEKHNG